MADYNWNEIYSIVENDNINSLSLSDNGNIVALGIPDNNKVIVYNKNPTTGKYE